MISALVANYCQTVLWRKWVLFLTGPLLLFLAHLIRNLITLMAINANSDRKLSWMYHEPGDLLLIVFVVVGLYSISRLLRWRTTCS